MNSIPSSPLPNNQFFSFIITTSYNHQTTMLPPRETNPHFLQQQHEPKPRPPPQNLRQRETNPHFLPPQQRPDQTQHPLSEHDPNLNFPIHDLQPLHEDKHPQPQGTQPQPRPSHQSRPNPQPSSRLDVPQGGTTKTITWFIAIFCLLFWIIIIVGGLIVLIVYLHFRPRSPKFDIASATLNAAYLDMGYLLNVDLTLLANFTNANRKVRVDFSYMIINLYYTNTLIATTYLDPFSAMNKMSTFRPVHMVSSQVPLAMGLSLLLTEQMQTNRIKFEVKGLFRTRSDLGGYLRYSYWLYSHCTVVMSSPPSGVCQPYGSPMAPHKPTSSPIWQVDHLANLQIDANTHHNDMSEDSCEGS